MKALELLELIKMMGVNIDISIVINEAIEELEELENRSCDSCIYVGKSNCINCLSCKRQYSDNWRNK